jgi:hypothetical protein
MANTYVDYTAVASQTDYNFSFEYLRDDHVKVKVNGTLVTNYTIVTSPTPTKIRFNTAPTAGATIKIYRDSRGDFSPLVDFVDGSVLTENELDESYKHNLFVSQESSEGTGGEQLTKKGLTHYDAEGNKIINLGTPTAATDAANKAYTEQTIDNAIALGGSPAIVSLGGYDVTALGTSRARSLANRFAEVFNVLDYGDTNTDTEIRAAVEAANTAGRGTVYIPEGEYTISNPIKLYNNIKIKGDGKFQTILNVASDIEVFNSDTATVSTALNSVEIKDLFINKTATGATTKYDIHLQNPNNCYIKNIRVKSGHNDSDYSETNVGGIWLDRPPGSTTSAFMNVIEDCWVQNNSIYLRDITDSIIREGFVWGHTREFAIRIEGGGANSVENMQGIITSKFKGGIWLDGTSTNQIRIMGNEWDGNPLLDTGIGIYAPQQTLSVVVANNTFWGCDKHGIHCIDPAGWSITGNQFWKNNAGDDSYDDIRIEGNAFQPNGNTVSGNSFLMDVARTNKGYAIREVNGGNNPVVNTYVGNSISGSTGYQNPPILVLQQATVLGNVGVGGENRVESNNQFNGSTDLGNDILDDTAIAGDLTVGLNTAVPAQTGGGQINFGSSSCLQKSVQIAGGSSNTVDLDLNTSGSDNGFAGLLIVEAVRVDYTVEQTKTVYAVTCRGTTPVFTSLATQDGSVSGLTFSLTVPSLGKIRFTDTSSTPSTSNVSVNLTFFGGRNLA